jgi:NAD(P)-dependent dehydrogenase (short-subunit alcohol dehydrogenase family)
MTGRRFEGKRAVVTGAGSGIGRAIAVRLAAEGARVGLLDVSEQGLMGTAELVRGVGAGGGGAPAAEPLLFRVDVADAEAAAAALEAFARQAGGLEIAVTAAGFGHIQTVLGLTPAEWRRMVDISLNGTFFCAQAAARLMGEQGRGGAIVLLSSINAFAPGKGNAHYSAAKAGVATFARAAAFELGAQGIRVNAIAPGGVRTPLAAMLTEDEALAAGYLALTPLGRFAEPEDIAAAAAFLASDDAAYITGHLLVVDGGITAGIDFIPGA